MQVDLFDFDLPEELIAQTPLKERTGSRLLVMDRQSGQVAHRAFTDLLSHMRKGDVLVLNDTKVIPARLLGTKTETGAKVEILLLKQEEGDRWEVLAKPAKRVKKGTEIVFGEEADGKPLLRAKVEEEMEMGGRRIQFSYSGIFHEILDQLGQMPLPPYIKEQLSERDRYQTVYAEHRGSAAAPTAGLHFTSDFLRALQEKGVEITTVTLHVGLGTFRPVSVETVEAHSMHAEYYQITAESAAVIARAKQEGRRVLAVGTTAARTLETLGQRFGGSRLEACSGWTDIFIYPGYSFQIVDGILTNFHLPKSTLVMMISAFAGREHVLHAYEEAVRERYRFFSFGDAMFIADL
ncbi:tRNA preQ1(34) S-adenosylmethionine ribosyltransferase-isomerase QueA [Marinicrinis sediminis]|uniref:S-adenosylmethionine:tRNA ribosyltransferase-isomerase n=1 Tax=Marinicrinis sediminis TaxID=1652465 RepID=A0ABW5R6Q2_9BACL